MNKMINKMMILKKNRITILLLQKNKIFHKSSVLSVEKELHIAVIDASIVIKNTKVCTMNACKNIKKTS